MIYWQVSIVKSNIHLSPWYIITDRYAGGIFFMYLEKVLKEFLFDCKMRKISERTITNYRNNNSSLFRIATGD